MDINKTILVGRLTKDAELKSLGSGTSVCNFSIAVNNRKKNGDQWEDVANFFEITAFGRQAETLHQYLLKGKQVGIDGRLEQDRWQDNNGQNHSKVKIIADNIQLLGGNANGNNNNGSNGSYQQSNGNNGGYKANWG